MITARASWRHFPGSLPDAVWAALLGFMLANEITNAASHVIHNEDLADLHGAKDRERSVEHLLIISGYLGGQIARQAWSCQGGQLDR